MNEMLANQRFLSARFDEALPLYNEIVNRGDFTVSVLRRRLVCEIIAGSLENATQYSIDLLQLDASALCEFVVGDDCPCPMLIDYITTHDDSLQGRYRIALLNLFGNVGHARNQFTELYKHTEGVIQDQSFRVLRVLEDIPCVFGT